LVCPKQRPGAKPGSRADNIALNEQSPLISSAFPLVHNTQLRALCGTLAIVVAVGLLIAGEANAVDGNYSSPYASQWDTRGAGAAVPNETIVGALLLVLNTLAATIPAAGSRGAGSAGN
jgi:hypothetical protein